MSERRLYEVEVRFTYYAEAESPREAEDFADDAWRDGGLERALVREVQHSDHRLIGEWSPECLVYGTESDVELSDLLEKLPARAGGAS